MGFVLSLLAIHNHLTNWYVLLLFRMVLVLNGVLQEECPADTRSLFAAHPVYRDTAAQLLGTPSKVVGPVGLLYVQQREMAATVPHDSESTAFTTQDYYPHTDHL